MTEGQLSTFWAPENVQSGSGRAVRIIARDGVEICRMAADAPEDYAALFVAAPDLLMALAWLHDLEQGRHAAEYQEQKLLAMGAARAAISKATGAA